MADTYLSDSFGYASWAEAKAAGWALRGTEYGSGNNRTLTRADDRAVSVVDGSLVLKVRPDPDNPGKHFVGHVTRGVLPFIYGWIEVDIKFHRPQGAHGSLWHQSGYSDGGAELDVVEWFGERMPNSNTIESQRVQHTVHVGPLWSDGTETLQYPRYTYTNEDNDAVDIPRYQGLDNQWLNKAWWNSFHTYACEWTPSGYRFFVDGIFVGRTVLPADGYSAPTAWKQGEVILSQLSNDGRERDDLLAHIADGGKYADFDMFVSRVEAKGL